MPTAEMDLLLHWGIVVACQQKTNNQSRLWEGMRHSSQNACCSISANTIAQLNSQWCTHLVHFVACYQDKMMYVFWKADWWNQTWCSLYTVPILLKAHTHEIFSFFLILLHYFFFFPTLSLHEELITNQIQCQLFNRFLSKLNELIGSPIWPLVLRPAL